MGPTTSSVASGRLGPLHVQEPAAHAKRHFFALSEWRSGSGGEIRCVVAVPPGLGAVPAARTTGAGAGAGMSAGVGAAPGRDMVVFAAGSRVIVVQGGLEFAEGVVSAASDGVFGQGVGGGVGHFGAGQGLGGMAQGVWKVVSGGMHRRASAW
jgi:hypothetical protein